MGTADNLPDETERSGDNNCDSVGLGEVDVSEGYQGVTAQGTAWGGTRRVQLTQSVAEALRSSQCSVSDSSTQRHGDIPPMREIAEKFIRAVLNFPRQIRDHTDLVL